MVRFTSGLEMTVTPEKFLVKMGGGVTAIRRQLPLRLAWAISVHKSQVLPDINKWNELQNIVQKLMYGSLQKSHYLMQCRFKAAYFFGKQAQAIAKSKTFNC